MTEKRQHHSKYEIVRHSIKNDVLWFGLPALLVFIAGLIVSGWDGYDGLVSTIWKVIRNPQGFYLLSFWNIAGMIQFVVGLTFAIVAAFTLGRLYSSSLVIRVNHRLIRHGLYRFTRHPIYFGVLVAIFGVPLYATSLHGFLVLSTLVPILLLRIRMEEHLLTDEFGDAYREYQRTTSKLIPFIY